jgi:hypothetical protein
MKATISHVMLTAAGMAIVAGFYDAVRHVDPPMYWPALLVFAALLVIGSLAIKASEGA